MIKPCIGQFLIADPHLNDLHFSRSVILLCEHTTEGSFGFVLNRKLEYNIDELIPELQNVQIPVFEGGPVEINTLHFLHQYPSQIPGGKEIVNGVYWGGSFENLIDLIVKNEIDLNKIKFFMGYSGWDADQLETELEENTWIQTQAKGKFIFDNNANSLWKNVMRELGGGYELFINAPIDPRMN